jgi:hypothetical protein
LNPKITLETFFVADLKIRHHGKVPEEKTPVKAKNTVKLWKRETLKKLNLTSFFFGGGGWTPQKIKMSHKQRKI